MRQIEIKTGRPYKITVGTAIAEQMVQGLKELSPQPEKIAVITDDLVDRFYGEKTMERLVQAGYSVCKFIFAQGEESKNLDTVSKAYAFLAQNNITRTDLIVALGGGVVGDLAGFVGSSWLRGIRFVQIPTTLLAMVDSSVGGKTGVDIPQGKNLVGAFWQPSAVFCDLNVLDTLSPEQFASGVAEIIKYGAIMDDALFTLLERGELRTRLLEVICRCIDLKRLVVEQDERDTGERQWLNFGHTLGHAIEKESKFSVFHGQAVAIGMVQITKACEQMGISPAGTADRISKCCQAYDLPVSCPYALEDLCRHCAGDKKRAGKRILLVTLARLGQAALTPVDAAQIQLFFEGKYNG